MQTGATHTRTPPDHPLTRVRSCAARRCAFDHCFPAEPFLILATLFGTQLLKDGVYYDRYIQDMFIHLNGILHFQRGELPHLSFETPIGFFYYYAFYLATFFAPAGAYTALYANALVAAVATTLCLLAGYRRLTAPWLAVLALYVGVVALTPRHLGQNAITFNAVYNQWSWALLTVLVLVVSIVRRDAQMQRAAVSDALIAGVLLTLLLFTKATAGLVGIGLLGVRLFTVRRNAQPLLFGALTILVVALAVAAIEASCGIVGAYLGNLQHAAAAQGFERRSQLVIMAYVLMIGNMWRCCTTASNFSGAMAARRVACSP